jgi:hypothetical protein
MALNGSLTRFLKRFWTALRVSSPRVAIPLRDGNASLTKPRLTASIEPEAAAAGVELDDAADVVSRFLFQKRHFKRAENRATPEAFMPPADLQLSTFLTTGMTAAGIWELGKETLALHPQPRLYGRAQLDVGVIKSQRLRALRDDDPPRHVNVVGWPTYADGKDLIKTIAQELARHSHLELLTPPLSK